MKETIVVKMEVDLQIVIQIISLKLNLKKDNKLEWN